MDCNSNINYLRNCSCRSRFKLKKLLLMSPEVIIQKTVTIKQRLITVLILLSIPFGIIFFTYRNPAESNLIPPCPLKYTTGLYCPGCGSGRAFHEILHGSLYKAFRLNPLMMIFLPFLLYAYISNWFLVIRGYKLPTFFLSGKLIIGILVILIVFGILRNISVRPFSLLAPTEVNTSIEPELKAPNSES